MTSSKLNVYWFFTVKSHRDVIKSKKSVKVFVFKFVTQQKIILMRRIKLAFTQKKLCLLDKLKSESWFMSWEL